MLSKYVFDVEIQWHAQQMTQRRVDKSVCEYVVCISEDVCLCVTCTKTEALLFKSQRNSAALSWEG